MYVILVYDISSRSSTKLLKICRQYLHWSQKSVFEGEISQAKLRELKNRLSSLLDFSQDSLLVYSVNNPKWIEKEIIGVEKNDISTFL